MEHIPDSAQLLRLIREAVMVPSHKKVPAIAGCYVIRSTATGRIYIGRSEFIRARLCGHMAALKAGDHHCAALQSDYRDHGSASFEFGVVIPCEGERDRDAIERALIKTAAALDRYNTVVYDGLMNAERQAAFKKRKAAIGLRQITIIAHPDDFPAIRAAAAQISAARA